MKYLRYYYEHGSYGNELIDEYKDSIYPNISLCDGSIFPFKHCHYRGFLPVEYAASTDDVNFGTIDSGYYANNETKVVCKFLILNNRDPLTKGNIPFGADDAYKSKAFVFMAIVNDTKSTIFEFGTDVSVYQNNMLSLNTFYTVILSKDTATVNGTAIATVPSNVGGSFTTTYPLQIFGLHRVNMAASSVYKDSFFIGRIYSLDIYDNDILVRKFRPVVRMSDNLCSLYDFVNDKFYVPTYNRSYVPGPILNY